MRTAAFVRRTLVAAGLCTAMFGLAAGVAQAKPEDCVSMQRQFDRIMANTEANWRTMAPIEWQVAREALWRVSDSMDAAGC